VTFGLHLLPGLGLIKEFITEKPFCHLSRKKRWCAFDRTFLGSTLFCTKPFQWITKQWLYGLLCFENFWSPNGINRRYSILPRSLTNWRPSESLHLSLPFIGRLRGGGLAIQARVTTRLRFFLFLPNATRIRIAIPTICLAWFLGSVSRLPLVSASNRGTAARIASKTPWHGSGPLGRTKSRGWSASETRRVRIEGRRQCWWEIVPWVFPGYNRICSSSVLKVCLPNRHEQFNREGSQNVREIVAKPFKGFWSSSIQLLNADLQREASGTDAYLAVNEWSARRW
jgi:hypothetical protein